MIGPGEVIMAADESASTMNKRLQAVGLEPTVGNQEAWRRLIVTAPSLKGVGAVILYEGTMGQVVGGRLIPQIFAERGIVPGVKLDAGKKEHIGPYGEGITYGLDGLYDKLIRYVPLGARFSKWRSELVIGDRTPSRAAIYANAAGLAQFAHSCQQADVVPTVEPEILIKGGHDQRRTYRVAREVLSELFEGLYKMGVYIPGTILKTSMITPGDKYQGGKATPEEVARITIDCFLDGELVPREIGGIAFLSGGLSDLDAVLYLNALNSPESRARAPWRLSASYGRAEIGEAWEHWRGIPERVAEAQAIIGERTKACGLASDGQLPAGFAYELVAQKPVK